MHYILWLASAVFMVKAQPWDKRQLNLFGTQRPNSAVAQTPAQLQQQQQTLLRLNAQQVSENVFRVQPMDPTATYSSALIILTPKEAQTSTVAGDLAKLGSSVGGLTAAGGNAPQVPGASVPPLLTLTSPAGTQNMPQNPPLQAQIAATPATQVQNVPVVPQKPGQNTAAQPLVGSNPPSLPQGVSISSGPASVNNASQPAGVQASTVSGAMIATTTVTTPVANVSNSALNPLMTTTTSAISSLPANVPTTPSLPVVNMSSSSASSNATSPPNGSPEVPAVVAQPISAATIIGAQAATNKALEGSGAIAQPLITGKPMNEGSQSIEALSPEDANTAAMRSTAVKTDQKQVQHGTSSEAVVPSSHEGKQEVIELSSNGEVQRANAFNGAGVETPEKPAFGAARGTIPIAQGLAKVASN